MSIGSMSPGSVRSTRSHRSKSGRSGAWVCTSSGTWSIRSITTTRTGRAASLLPRDRNSDVRDRFCRQRRDCLQGQARCRAMRQGPVVHGFRVGSRDPGLCRARVHFERRARRPAEDAEATRRQRCRSQNNQREQPHQRCISLLGVQCDLRSYNFV